MYNVVVAQVVTVNTEQLGGGAGDGAGQTDLGAEERGTPLMTDDRLGTLGCAR